MVISAGSTKAKDYLIAALLVLVVGGGIAAGGFFQDEITSYVRLQGWNLSPVVEANRKFLRAAASGDSAQVEALIAKNAPHLRPVRKNGKIHAFMIGDYGDPIERPLKVMAPSAEPVVSSPRMVYLEGGTVQIQATYAGSHALQLSWDRMTEGWRLKAIGWLAQ